MIRIDSPLHAAALAYAELGYRVFPVMEQGNAPPLIKDWPNLATTDPDVIRAWWERRPSANIAIATRDLLVVDRDDVAAEKPWLADDPEREFSLGSAPTMRTPRGGTHHVFGDPRNRWKSSQSELADHVDTRARDGYIVVPPSARPDGEYAVMVPLVSVVELPPVPDWLVPQLDDNTNNGSGDGVSVETLLATGAPPGQRNAATARVAGFYFGKGLELDTVAALVRKWNADKNRVPLSDAEVVKTVESIARKDARTLQGRARVSAPPPNGTPAEPPGPARPEIHLTSEIEGIADQGMRALAAMPGRVFHRAHVLVEVRRSEPRAGSLRRSAGAPVAVKIADPRLRALLATSAEWWGGKDGKQRTIPPDWAVKALAARPTWDLPELVGIAEAPFLRPDGTVCQESGYDESSGILFEPPPGVTFPPIPDEPTRDDARAALQFLRDPLRDFRFVTDSDRDAAVAAMLTILGRAAIDGPTPLFHCGAPVRGSGKTLLAKLIAIVGTGRDPAIMAPNCNDDELRKELVAIGLAGDQVVLIDNIEGSFGSPVLAGALTSDSFEGRLLGQSRMVTVPLRPVWLTTGNNVAWRGDIGRRVVPIDQDPGVESPEDRTGFAYSPLLPHVHAQRPQLVVAALTILRSHAAAGRPVHGSSRMGSFESWDDVVRSAMSWAGGEDPCAGRVRVREEADTDWQDLAQVLAALDGAAPILGSEWTVRSAVDVVNTARENAKIGRVTGDVVGALDEALQIASDSFYLDPRKIGRWLRARKGRIVAGLRLDQGGLTSKVQRWHVSTIVPE